MQVSDKTAAKRCSAGMKGSVLMPLTAPEPCVTAPGVIVLVSANLTGIQSQGKSRRQRLWDFV